MVTREDASGRNQETEMLLRAVARAVKPYKAGSLAKASLAHLFVYFEHHALSGSLWLHDETQDSTIQFLGGAPAKVKTTLSVPHLGTLLMELGYIDQRAYDETINFALRGGGLHGAMLVACGLLDAAGLDAGLREQTALRIIEVFRHVRRETRFAFFRDVDLLASWGGVELTPVDPHWALWWGMRDRNADETVDIALGLLGDDPIVMQPSVAWTRFGFDDEEKAFLSWWAGRGATVEMLTSYPDMARDRIANLLFVLFLTRSIAYEEAPPTRVRQAPQAAVRPPMDSVTQLLPRPPVSETQIQIDPGPQVSLPDTTLETDAPDFDDEEVVTDFEIPVLVDPSEQQQVVTPRAPAFDPPAIREQEAAQPVEREPSTQAVTRMAQAFQTLLDPVEQAQAEEQPAPRVPTHSELDLARSAEALQWSSRCNNALRDGKYKEAERCAAKALELAPENALLKTEYAWAASLLPARRKIGDMGDLLDMLNEATESDPALDKAYYVRGTIFEYLGMYAKAYAEFRAAFARNSHNADAAEKIQTYVRRIKATGSVEPDGKEQQKKSVGAVAIPAKAGAMIAKLWRRG